jgi:predicted transcriptional regulator
MDQAGNNKIVLLAVQPTYVKSIISGKKKVEFRRKKFAKSVSRIVIYETRPVQKVVAYFKVSHVTQATPNKLWKKYNNVGGIKKHKFREYFKGAREAVAIGIDSVKVFTKPVALNKISNRLSPPQSYAYISESVFDKLCKFESTHVLA